jgi:hypothetical protein
LEVQEGRGADTTRVGEPANEASRRESQSLSAALAGLQAERERLIAERDAAARLAQLYKEVATSRQATGTPEPYPTARHVTSAMGRLLRKSLMLQEAFKGKQLEDLSPEEQEMMKNGGVAMMREVATLTEARLHFSEQAQEANDPIDEMTVFVYGALDLDEPQFHKTYSLLRMLQDEAAGLVAGGSNPSEDERARLKAKGGGLLRALLRPEQQRLLQLLEPHLSLVRFPPAH